MKKNLIKALAALALAPAMLLAGCSADGNGDTPEETSASVSDGAANDGNSADAGEDKLYLVLTLPLSQWALPMSRTT